ncbi:MAG: NADH-quinone oxidoreductase subunit J [Deltaproteobacteria bacterium]|jgi:NADH-quinone oxidoreductase subunit J|nr:NADH-quinone oxidoreductase subunit J [Deltaproteobacteria bacterium]
MSAQIAFYVLALGALVSALGVVLVRNPITSALNLVVSLCFVAGLYALLEAHFVAAVQVTVYAGAIMVLFTFVIMLLDLGTVPARTGPPEGIPKATIMGALGAAFVGLVIHAVRGDIRVPTTAGMAPERVAELGGNSRLVGELLFGPYLLPFEVAGVLLLVALVGTVVMAKRDSVAKSTASRRNS